MSEEGQKITKDMTLGDVVAKYPETARVMMSYGLHCIGCHVAAWETIEQGAMGHGMSQEDLEKMMKDLNEVAE